MASLKLTKRAVERLEAPHPSGRQTLVWDSELKGFGVLLSGKSASKSYVAQHRLANGLTRRVTLAPCNVIDLDGARALARKTLAEFYTGADPKAERRKRARRGATLRSTLDAYLAARKDLKPKSVGDYRAVVERHLANWLDLPLSEISPEMVEARHREIKSAVERRGGTATGAATANAVFRTFRLLWNYGQELDPELPPNPTRRLRRAWYAVPARTRMVMPEDLPRFYAAVDALPNRIAGDYIKLLLFTGLRRREAGGLRWSEVDFVSRVIRLPAEKTKAGRKLDLPMSGFVRDLLIARRALGDDGGFVFGSDGKTGHISGPGRALDEVAKATGIAVSPHDLRRSFITIAEGCDISPLALKGLVNHALGNDVTSGYVVMSCERLREPAQRVADRIAQLCGVGAPEGVAKLGA
jgi:integrase